METELKQVWLRFVLLGCVGMLVFVGACGSAAQPGGGPLAVLEVLNAIPPGAAEVIVVQGERVEVQFVFDSTADTSLLDSIQLRRLDDGSPVSQRLRGDRLSGVVLLNTDSDDALGRLEVVCVRVHGTVLAVAEEQVLVVERAPDPEHTVIVPSPEAPTIQKGIDLVADGGTVMIAPGEYQVDLQNPIVVTGKSVTIQGAGSMRDPSLGSRDLTRIVAPPPTGVVDAERATGVINYLGGGGVLRDLDVSGGDACVVGRDLRGGRPLLVKQATLSNTGRGILWKAPSALTVMSSEISDCTWNGVSFSPGRVVPAIFFELSMKFIGNIGIYASFSECYFEDEFLVGCKGGGIVLEKCLFDVRDSELVGNYIAGITLYQCMGVITDNYIWGSKPRPADGFFGDGIDAFLCQLVVVTDNLVWDSARASVANFASTMRLKSNDLQCAGYELEGEELHADFLGPGIPSQTTPFLFVDDGGNVCGCPDANGACVVETAGLAPPEPTAPIE